MTTATNALATLSRPRVPVLARIPAVTRVAKRFKTAAVHAAEREAVRIASGGRSAHVALTARLLPAEHSARAAVAALHAAQRDASPVVLDVPPLAALVALCAAETQSAALGLLTAHDLATSIKTPLAWIWRRPLSPRAPASARLA